MFWYKCYVFRMGDINWMDENGWTALDHAVCKNQLKNAKLLLDYGAGKSA